MTAWKNCHTHITLIEKNQNFCMIRNIKQILNCNRIAVFTQHFMISLTSNKNNYFNEQYK